MSRIIVLDWGCLSHQSIFATFNNPNVPATYTCLSSIIGCLKKVGVSKEDKIIIGVDYRSSWRRKILPEYKANRSQKRKESLINWEKEFKAMDWLLDKIDNATSFSVIKLPHIECDDIMAVCCRYFKDKEKILVTFDGDMQQLWSLGNVKIFSPKTKRYKIPPKNYDAYKDILKKVDKEVSDNIVNPILCEEDFNNRLKCVNLLELPLEVENQIIAELDNLEEKEDYIELLPYNTLKERFNQIYNEGTEPYEKSVKYYERKEKQKLKKKALKRGKNND